MIDWGMMGIDANININYFTYITIYAPKFDLDWVDAITRNFWSSDTSS